MDAPQKKQRSMTHSVQSATLADVLERILDKGLVIAGDIKIKIVDIELLTIQIRLLVCSVDKAREMGIDWWTTSPYLNAKLAQENGPAKLPTPEQANEQAQNSHLLERVERMEAALQASRIQPGAVVGP